MAYDQKRLDTLIRQGMMPAKQLPILKRALEKLKGGQIPNPYEREAISKLLDKTLGFQFGDDVTYNRARLHTQRTRYQTEEKKMAKDKEGEDVVVYDGSEDEAEAKRDKKVKKNGKSKILKSNKGDGIKSDEEEVKEDVKAELASIAKDRKVQSTKAAARPADQGQEEGDQESPKQGGSQVPEVGELCDGQDTKPSIKEGLIADLDSEGMRARATRLARRKGRGSKEKMAKDLPAALRKEKQKAGLSEDLARFNELYNENLQRALANNNVDNVRDIPEKIKADLFKHVEEATYSNKQLRMAKGIAFDKRHKGGDMTGAYKKMEKIKKGLGDTKTASDALRRANEEVDLDETVELEMDGQLYELKKSTLKSYLKKTLDPDTRKDGSLVDKAAWKRETVQGGWDKGEKQYANKRVKASEKGVRRAVKKLGGDKTMAGKYIKKNIKDKAGTFRDHASTRSGTLSKDPDFSGKTEKKRNKGMERAINRLGKEAGVKESVVVGSPTLDTPKGEYKKPVGRLVVGKPKQAKKDHDGDGKIETGKQEYMGSRDKAIKKAMKKKGIAEAALEVMLGEGAREDAMRDIARDKDLAKPKKPSAPKPGKSKHDGSENKGPAHIVAQLRGVLDQGDKHGGVKFRDGNTHKVSVGDAHKYLNKYMKGKPADKMKMQDHGHASHDNFKKHLD